MKLTQSRFVTPVAEEGNNQSSYLETDQRHGGGDGRVRREHGGRKKGRGGGVVIIMIKAMSKRVTSGARYDGKERKEKR